jgi:ribosomal protein L11 methyltransferase
MHRSWYLIEITVARPAEDLVSGILFELGSTGIVTLNETEAETKLGAYFDDAREPPAISEAIQKQINWARLADSVLSYCWSEVPDQDWMQKWKEGFEPLEVGRKLLIAPSWRMPGDAGGRIVIQMDPGMAFGTGTHETTRLCLESIERYWRGGNLLDVGCGTGILAIAGALLQPGSRITAIDIDPQAVEVARDNVSANRVQESVEVTEGGISVVSGKVFKVVVANLTAEVLVDLAQKLAASIAPGGVLIASGILSPAAATVEAALKVAGLVVTEQTGAGEWAALVVRKY